MAEAGRPSIFPAQRNRQGQKDHPRRAEVIEARPIKTRWALFPTKR
jgi:hypothetical protein